MSLRAALQNTVDDVEQLLAARDARAVRPVDEPTPGRTALHSLADYLLETIAESPDVMVLFDRPGVEELLEWIGETTQVLVAVIGADDSEIAVSLSPLLEQRGVPLIPQPRSRPATKTLSSEDFMAHVHNTFMAEPVQPSLSPEEEAAEAAARDRHGLLWARFEELLASGYEPEFDIHCDEDLEELFAELDAREQG